MIKKLINLVLKTGKTATKTTGKSMDFIDDLLEKEYIGSAVDNLKTSSGKVIEKAGMLYEKAKIAVDENLDIDSVDDLKDKIIEKGKEAKEKLSEELEESAATIKQVFEEGENMIKDLTGQEEE